MVALIAFSTAATSSRRVGAHLEAVDAARAVAELLQLRELDVGVGAWPPSGELAEADDLELLAAERDRVAGFRRLRRA
jgi:hypothetical protein